MFQSTNQNWLYLSMDFPWIFHISHPLKIGNWGVQSHVEVVLLDGDSQVTMGFGTKMFGPVLDTFISLW